MTTYAIVVDGSRQLKVEEDQVLRIDYRQDAASGDELTFDRILAYHGTDGIRIGQPTLDDVTITAEVQGVAQGDKIHVQKFRRRKNYRRKTGHRQLYTEVKITKISA